MRTHITKDEFETLINSRKNLVSENLKEMRRWYAVYDVVFEENGLFYQFSYNVPLTELQEIEPFDGDTQKVEQVYKCTVEETKYLTLNEFNFLIKKRI